jgi:hypothetical protein
MATRSSAPRRARSPTRAPSRSAAIVLAVVPRRACHHGHACRPGEPRRAAATGVDLAALFFLPERRIFSYYDIMEGCMEGYIRG